MRRIAYIVTAGLVVFGVVLWSSNSPTPARAPIRNVVLISLDTTRADYLGCYGHTGSTTPNIDAVAAEGVLFENVVAPVPLTLPSHVSMLTGTSPPYHGVHDNLSMALRPDIQTIAQMVSDDYATGYVGKWHLGDEIVKQRGFDEWVSANDYWWPEYTNPEVQRQFSDYHEFLVAEGYVPEQDHPGGKTFSQEQRAAMPPLEGVQAAQLRLAHPGAPEACTGDNLWA